MIFQLLSANIIFAVDECSCKKWYEGTYTHSRWLRELPTYLGAAECQENHCTISIKSYSLRNCIQTTLCLVIPAGSLAYSGDI